MSNEKPLSQKEIENIPAFLDEIEKAAKCIYTATDAEVAADISLKLMKCSELIKRALL